MFDEINIKNAEIRLDLKRNSLLLQYEDNGKIYYKVG